MRSTAVRLPAAVWLVVLAACPTFPSSDPYRCDLAEDCPPGRACGPDGTCLPAGGTPETADAGEPDAGEPGASDAGASDAGADGPDAGPGGPDGGAPGVANVRLLNAAGDGPAFDLWRLAPGPVAVVAAAVDHDLASSSLGIVAVDGTLGIAPAGTPTSAGVVASLRLDPADGEDVVLVAGGDPLALTRVTMRESSASPTRNAVLKLAPALATGAADFGANGSIDVAGLEEGVPAYRTAGTSMLGGPVAFNAGPGRDFHFSTAGASAGAGPHLILFTGRPEAHGLASDAFRLVALGEASPTTLRTDARIAAFNDTSPFAPIRLRVDGVLAAGGAESRGVFTGERFASTGRHVVSVESEDPGLAAVELPLEASAGLSYVVLAVRSGVPGSPLRLATFVDRVGPPKAGAALCDVMSLIPGRTIDVAIRAGRVLHGEFDGLGFGDMPTGGLGAAIAAGPITVTLTTDLPMPVGNAFNLTLEANARCLLAVELTEPGVPVVRVLRRVGATYEGQLVHPG